MATALHEMGEQKAALSHAIEALRIVEQHVSSQDVVAPLGDFSKLDILFPLLNILSWSNQAGLRVDENFLPKFERLRKRMKLC